MSLAAVLKIEGQPKDGIKVLSCSFSFSQNVDDLGMWASKVRIGMINLVIPHINDTTIINWMKGVDSRKNGEIIFSGYSDRVPRQSVLFEDGVLIHYQESFSDPSDTQISLTISCRKITVLGVPFENTWIA
jgi:hypothetical protein